MVVMMMLMRDDRRSRHEEDRVGVRSARGFPRMQQLYVGCVERKNTCWDMRERTNNITNTATQ
eukprot:6153838-Pyramimonas_sp.AAC.1